MVGHWLTISIVSSTNKPEPSGTANTNSENANTSNTSNTTISDEGAIYTYTTSDDTSATVPKAEVIAYTKGKDGPTKIVKRQLTIIQE